MNDLDPQPMSSAGQRLRFQLTNWVPIPLLKNARLTQYTELPAAISETSRALRSAVRLTCLADVRHRAVKGDPRRSLFVDQHAAI